MQAYIKDLVLSILFLPDCIWKECSDNFVLGLDWAWITSTNCSFKFLGQRGRYLAGIGYLSFRVILLTSEISQFRQMAMIDRQSTMIEIEGRGSKDNV